MPDAFDRLRSGSGCPLCAPRSAFSEQRYFVQQLAASSLYLTREQTYRGRCLLVYDARHVSRLDELELPEWQLLAQDLWSAERALVATFAPQHINVESLGNEVPHLHWHLIPRYRDDGRWGGPIWTSERPQTPPTLLTDEECALLAQALLARLLRPAEKG
jgi:diadenosine tetraphosphate (Ap4A) HIT family hydrolase